MLNNQNNVLPAMSLQHTEVEPYSGRRRRINYAKLSPFFADFLRQLLYYSFWLILMCCTVWFLCISLYSTV